MSGTSKAHALRLLSFTAGDLGHRASQSLESCHVLESEAALTFLAPDSPGPRQVADLLCCHRKLYVMSPAPRIYNSV